MATVALHLYSSTSPDFLLFLYAIPKEAIINFRILFYMPDYDCHSLLAQTIEEAPQFSEIEDFVLRHNSISETSLFDSNEIFRHILELKHSNCPLRSVRILFKNKFVVNSVYKLIFLIQYSCYGNNQ